MKKNPWYAVALTPTFWTILTDRENHQACLERIKIADEDLIRQGIPHGWKCYDDGSKEDIIYVLQIA